MKRRPYIPSRARTVRPIAPPPPPTDDERVVKLQAQVARLKELIDGQADEVKRLRAIIWERTRDEAYAPESYWSGITTFGT